MQRKVQRVKDSYHVVIPKHFAQMMGIIPGIMMEVEYVNEKIVMTPVTRQDEPGISQE